MVMAVVGAMAGRGGEGCTTSAVVGCCACSLCSRHWREDSLQSGPDALVLMLAPRACCSPHWAVSETRLTGESNVSVDANARIPEIRHGAYTPDEPTRGSVMVVPPIAAHVSTEMRHEE